MQDAGIAATHVSSTVFTVAEDKTGEEGFYPGRRVRLNCGVDGIRYTDVFTASYSAGSGLTTVTVNQAVVTPNLTKAWWSVIGPGKVGGVPARQVMNISSTPTTTTIDLDNGNNWAVALTMNNSCNIVFANAPAGYCCIVMRITQDATGARTWSNQTSYRWPMGVMLPLSTAAGARDDYQIYTFDAGTTWNAAMIGAEIQ